MTDPRAFKKQLRAELRARLAELSPAQVAQASHFIGQRIASDPGFSAAGVVLGFVPMASRPEVDLRPFLLMALHEGKTVALPRVDWPSRSMSAHRVTDLFADLEPDPGNPSAGLMQPRATCPEVPLGSLDLLLIPGLGFDLRGGRIGHGAGFYDRFLARHEAAGGRGTVCGVGFEAQVLPDGQFLPREPHDRPLAALVTEARSLRFPGLAPGRPE